MGKNTARFPIKRALFILIPSFTVLVVGVLLIERSIQRSTEEEVKRTLGKLSQYASIDYDGLVVSLLRQQCEIRGLRVWNDKDEVTIDRLTVFDIDRDHPIPHFVDIRLSGIHNVRSQTQSLTSGWLQFLETQLSGNELTVELYYRFEPENTELIIERLTLDNRLVSAVFKLHLSGLSFDMENGWGKWISTLPSVLLHSASVEFTKADLLGVFAANAMFINAMPFNEYFTQIVKPAIDKLGIKKKETVFAIEQFIDAPGEFQIQFAPHIPMPISRLLSDGSWMERIEVEKSAGKRSLSALADDFLQRRLEHHANTAQTAWANGDRLSAALLVRRAEQMNANNSMLKELVTALDEEPAGDYKKWPSLKPGQSAQGCRFNANGSLTCGEHTPVFIKTAPSVMVSPRSPSGRFLLAFTSSDYIGSLNYLVDLRANKVSDSNCYKYGSEPWVMWSADERYALLAAAGDGSQWLCRITLHGPRTGEMRQLSFHDLVPNCPALQLDLASATWTGAGTLSLISEFCCPERPELGYCMQGDPSITRRIDIDVPAARFRVSTLF